MRRSSCKRLVARPAALRGRLRFVLTAAIAVLLLVLSTFGFASDVDAQVADGLVVDSTTIYEPDTEREQINVQSTYTMTNVQADEYFGDTVRSYFFTKWIVALPANVVDFAATSGGTPLTTVIEADDDGPEIVLGTISLPYNLRFRQTVTIDVRYTIPGDDPRTDGSIARINDSFLSLAVWATGDPGMTDVTIVIPDGFSTDIEGDLDGLLEVSRDGQTVLEAIDIESPQDFFGQVFGRNDDGLLTVSADLPDGTATVRAWPDDPTWAEFVVDAIEDDVPVIEELIGLPWPAGDIEVIETVTPYLLGYGGWFNATSGVIEIGEDLERDLILHELSHAWFNDELIGGRWITEGLAEEFASRTMEATGDTRPDPEEPDLSDPIRVPLARWASPWTLDEEDAFDYERYHYNASWWVIRQITDDIGVEALSDVLVSLDADEMPYGGDGPIEQTTQSTRWTHFFDLLERQAGATDLDALFSDYVLSAPDIAKLVPRRIALDDYDEFVAASGDWSPPLVVRRQLTTWRFDDALSLIEDAEEVIEVRDAADALALELGITIEHPAEMVFETAADRRDLEDALEQEEALVGDLEALESDRQSVIDAAAAIDTRVEFAPLDYEGAVEEIAAQQAAIDEVAALREEVHDAALVLGLDSPDWPSPSGPTDFDAAADLAEARLATLAAIADATATLDAPRSFAARVGLWGSDPDAALASARAAFETDDLDESLIETARAEAMIADASSTGQTRLTWAGVLAATLLLATLLFLWLRRRAQPTATEPPATEPTATPAPPTEPTATPVTPTEPPATEPPATPVTPTEPTATEPTATPVTPEIPGTAGAPLAGEEPT